MCVGIPWLCEKRLSVIRCLVWQGEQNRTGNGEPEEEHETWNTEREQERKTENSKQKARVAMSSNFPHLWAAQRRSGFSWKGGTLGLFSGPGRAANEWQSYYVAANAAFLLLTYSACRRNQSVNKCRRGIAAAASAVGKSRNRLSNPLLQRAITECSYICGRFRGIKRLLHAPFLDYSSTMGS